MENEKYHSTTNPVFKLADLVKRYTDRLAQLHGDISSPQPHTCRVRQRIERQMPDITSYKEGRDIYMIFNQDVAGAIKHAVDRDSELLQLARSAKKLRKSILEASTEFT